VVQVQAAGGEDTHLDPVSDPLGGAGFRMLESVRPSPGPPRQRSGPFAYLEWRRNGKGGTKASISP